MGKLKVSGQSGVAAQYYTRSQALRKLQVNLQDFRRLCILKGIYPRDPKKKSNGRDKTYYHKKDIMFLQHEPLLEKFRQTKIYLRKHKRLTHRHEDSRVALLESNRPVLTLDHLIRERFPSFSDALRDMDDALTLVHLFGQVPTGTTKYHSSQVPEQCLSICREFQSYVVRERCLRKVFVSIKGVYLQAIVNGQTITWIVPHRFAQQMPDDVDYKVMLTFLDFYMTLTRFVNFKLYNDVGLVYPPKVDQAKEDKGQLISSVVLENVAVDDAADVIDPEFAVNREQQDEVAEVFAGCRFMLSRETPADLLELIIRSGGGSVIREEDMNDADQSSITHQVIDRPSVDQTHNREYIQPQWVFDSFNMRSQLPVHPYGVNVALPAHLSPFVDDNVEGYVPTQRRQLDEWAKNMSAVAESDNEEEDSDDEDVEIAPKKRSRVDPVVGADVDAGASDVVDEEKELAKIMMKSKDKRLYGRMQFGIDKKKNANRQLESKRRKIEAASTK